LAYMNLICNTVDVIKVTSYQYLNRDYRVMSWVTTIVQKLEKFTNPDSRNAVALIVLFIGETSEEEIGVARYVIDPDGVNCEFAIVVADAWQKRGIGTRLMNALIKHLQASGVKRISGSVLKRNSAMRKFVKQMGFVETNLPDDPSILLVTKNLTD
jgi:acetyltransferase